ncbi:MAG: DNA alkylation repair protein [Planctomycetota bacterium]
MTEPAIEAAAVAFVQHELELRRDPHKAVAMAAYMKTTSPFWGVQKPDRVPILRELKRRHPARSCDDYRRVVTALWNLPHREERYLAIDYAMAHKRLIGVDLLDLYEHMIRSGAWWDVVDPVAIHLVGAAFLAERRVVAKVLDGWVEHEDLWLRRSAVIAQIRHKQETDAARLFRYCRARASDTDFFIRKAIGWALREYSYHAPAAVAQFLTDHRDRLSGLSLREGAKQLRRLGLSANLD